MGETRVDLVHLLEDLRDAYPGPLEETILTEIVANALDSGARSLRLAPEPATATLVAIDDGAGMSRRELSRYHDLATTRKTRGRGIGFAGVGIKLGLLACETVVTETRRGRQHAATTWRLANRSRAPWSWVPPPGLLEAEGTAVSLRLSNPLSPLLDPGFLEATVLRNFQPLFEPEFIDILAPVYPAGMAISIGDHIVVGSRPQGDRVPLGIRVGRQRKPSAVGYLARHPFPLPEPERGLAISTLGKVIRRGWDWLGMTPVDGDRIEGLIEVPALAEALTLNKGDFLRAGPRGALFLSFRKAIQEAVTAQLAAWGEAPEPRRRMPRTRPIERDLHRVLGELAQDFPLLATLAERRPGGQRRLALGAPGTDGGGLEGGGAALHGRGDGTSGGPTGGGGGEGSGGDTPPPAPDPHLPPADDAGPGAASAQLPARSGRKKRTRLSLEIRFETLEGEERLGRLIESIVWINDAHPAYRRAATSRAEGYHIALTVASALAPLTVDAPRTQEFVNAFLARWGEGAFERPRRPRGDSG